MQKNLSRFASSSTEKFWIKGIDLSLNTCCMMRWHNWLSPFLLSTCKHIALDNPLGLTNPGKEDLGLPEFTITYALCIHALICIHRYLISSFFFSDMYSIARSAYLVKKLSKKDFLGMVYYISFGGRGKKSFQCNLSQFLRQSSILSYFLFVNYKYASSWY